MSDKKKYGAKTFYMVSLRDFAKMARHKFPEIVPDVDAFVERNHWGCENANSNFQIDVKLVNMKTFIFYMFWDNEEHRKKMQEYFSCYDYVDVLMLKY